MPGRQLFLAKNNLLQVRKEILSKMPDSLFLPSNDELLIDWMTDGQRYTRGIRLSALDQNIGVHPESHRRWLTDEALHYIRHIIFSFSIPVTKFTSLMNCFAVLLLRKVLKLDEFLDTAQLVPRILRLDAIDRFRWAKDFNAYITSPHEHGFHRLFYSVSDDSKHFKRNRHALLISRHAGLLNSCQYDPARFGED